MTFRDYDSDTDEDFNLYGSPVQRPAPVRRQTYVRNRRRERRKALSQRHFKDGISYFIPKAKKKWGYWRKFDFEQVARMTPDQIGEANCIVCKSCGDAFTRRSFSKSMALFGCSCRAACNMCMALMDCGTLKIKVTKCPMCSVSSWC